MLETETLVSPAWSVLPSGCSWSLYFAQSVTEAIASRALVLNGLTILHNKTKIWSWVDTRTQAYYVYDDNLGVIAKTQQEADTVLEQWKNLFTEHGLYLHKSELSQKVKSFGIEMDGLSLCCRVNSERFWTLRRALGGILRRRKITGRALEIVVGHITFVLLGARPALCTPHTCYRFMRAHYHVAARLWTETRAELVAVRGLLIFSQSEWTRSWNTRENSTGSSLSGWRMIHADWPKEVVGRMGRVSEPGARESALAASRVVLDDDQWILEGADDEDEKIGFNVDPSFELARTLSVECVRIWSFECRWRSRLFALIVILRRAAAYILARDMVIVSRWIISEMNTSDAPSWPQGQK